jgi:phosphoribosylamine--glycine ligase
MGDPETQSVFARLKTDLVDLCKATAEGRLQEIEIETDERAAASIILVSGGYPGAYEKGKAISGLEQVEHSLIFHAGTKKADGKVLTNGGRVMAVTAYGTHFKEALQTALADAGKVAFEGKYNRSDIGFDL